MHKVSYLYVGGAVVLWASTAAIGKLLLADISNLQLTFFASIFAIIVLLGIVLVQGKTKLLKSYCAKDYLRMAAMGVLGCAAYPLFLFGAIEHAPAQEAFIINYLWPLMVALFAIPILKEKWALRKILGLLLGFFGVYVVATQGAVAEAAFSSFRGDMYALLGAISYGLFSVLGKKYGYEPFTSMLIYYCFGFVLLVIAFFVFSEVPDLSLPQLAGLVWLGVMTNALAFVFWFKSLARGDTTRMANFVFLTPFLSLVYIYFLLGEKILLSSFIGLGLIVLGILAQKTAVDKIKNNI